jgi:hypothetical protein
VNVRLARSETERQIFDLKRWMNKPNSVEEMEDRAKFLLYRLLSFVPNSVLDQGGMVGVMNRLEERFGLPKPDRRGYKSVEDSSPDTKGDLS